MLHWFYYVCFIYSGAALKKFLNAVKAALERAAIKSTEWTNSTNGTELRREWRVLLEVSLNVYLGYNYRIGTEMVEKPSVQNF